MAIDAPDSGTPQSDERNLDSEAAPIIAPQKGRNMTSSASRRPKFHVGVTAPARPRQIALLMLCGALVLVPLACASNGGASGGGSGSSTITIAQASSVDSMEPDVEPARSSLRIDEEILEAATHYVSHNGIPVVEPDLAQSWRQLSPTVWQFRLRPGVKFTDGEPLTASDFKFALDTYRANKDAGAFVFSNVQITVVSPLVFDVTTSTKNFGALPAAMTFLFPFPPKYFQRVGKTGFGNAPVGTGPYMLKNFLHGSSITLVANPGYWGPKPSIRTLIFRFVADDATRVDMLQAGEANVVADLPPALAQRVQGLSSARLESIESQRRIFFFFNNNVKPTSSVLVRQAMNYAVNTQSIIKNLFLGHAYPLKGIFIPGELGYDPSFQGYPYDPAKARQLLAKAGYPHGLTVKLYYTIDATVLDQQTAQAVAGMLQQVGIHAQMIGGTENAQEAVYDPGHMEGMGEWSYGPIYGDSYFLTNVASFSSSALYGGYSQDATTNQLTAVAVATTSTSQRQARYEQVQDYVIAKKADWIPLYALQDLYGVSKCVHWSPRADQNYAFETATSTC